MNGEPGWRRRRERRRRQQRLRRLNEAFYDSQPGLYLTTRLAHYALVASNDEAHRTRLAEGIALDQVSIALNITHPATKLPSWSQRVAAVEGEALSALASETVLRWTHAHATQTVEAPWFEMASMTSFAKFKQWVRTRIVDADHVDLERLVRDTFPLPPDIPVALTTVAEWLRAFGRTFLQAEGYNATKHGLAVTGRSIEFRLEVSGEELIRAQGNQVEFLRSERTGPGEYRFFRTDVLTDPAVVVPFVEAASRLLEALEARGRTRFLGEPVSSMPALPRFKTVMGALGYDGTPTLRTDREIVLDGLQVGDLKVSFHPRRTPRFAAPPGSPK